MAECPVCHRPLPILRLFRTTAWGSFYCQGCDSKLGVNMKRRFLALVPWMGILFFLLIVVRIMAYGIVFTLAVLAPILFIIFAIFDRAVVLERAGLRCPECGYDMQGQTEPVCSECGNHLSDEDAQRLARLRGGATEESTRRQSVASRGRVWGNMLIIIAIVVASLSLVTGVVLYRTSTRRASVAPETQLLTAAMLTYVQNHGGREPDHILRAAHEDALTTHQFILTTSATRRNGIGIGTTDLASIEGMSTQDRLALFDALDAGLADEVIAYRVGDFVFCYHGIDLPASGEAGGLWLMIGLPDPDQNASPAADAMIPVGLADGSVRRVPWTTFSAELAEQNALRTRLGLPPIPDPASITHDGPVVAIPSVERD